MGRNGKSWKVLAADLQRAQDKIGELRSLIEVSALISAALDLEICLRNVMELAKKVMKADASALMLLDQETNELVFQVALGEVGEVLEKDQKGFRLKMGQGIAGYVAETGRAELIPDAYAHPRFNPDFDKRTGYRTRSMLTVPLKVKNRIIGVSQVINKLDGTPFNEDDLEVFQTFCSQAAIAIDNANLHREIVAQERLKKDLEFARNVQESFLPQEVPQVEGYEFAAKYMAALDVGGDFYDFVDLGGGRWGVVLGDVSGKGVSAALYMARLAADLRFYSFAESDPRRALELINDALVERSRRGMFATLLFLLVDTVNNTATMVNCGHLPPIYRSADGKVRKIEKPKNTPLGILPETKLDSLDFEIRPGDLLFLYTDGVIEAKNAKNEMLGFGPVEKILAGREASSPEGLVGAIVDRIEQFSAGHAQHDDTTMLAIRRA